MRMERERADLRSLVEGGSGMVGREEGGETRGSDEYGRDGPYSWVAEPGFEIPSLGEVEQEERRVGEGNVERQGSWSVGDDLSYGAGNTVSAFAMPYAPEDASVDAGGGTGLSVRSSIQGLAPRSDVSAKICFCYDPLIPS